MARASTGQLIQSKRTGIWSARVTVSGRRVCQSLGTTSRAEAELKLARLLAGAEPSAPETFSEATRRVCARLARPRRLARLERFALPELGAMAPADIKRDDVHAMLCAMAEQGYARSTIAQVLADVRAILEDLILDGRLARPNVASKLPLPRSAKRDRRERVRLSDVEFSAFVGACSDVELVALAVLSRCIGGLRASDLAALTWTAIRDGAIHVYRPKTGSESTFEIPSPVLPFVETLWTDRGQPSDGALFPGRRSDYARRLRRALWRAGVRRGPSKSECALQSDTARTRRVDFHSFRRAWVDAAARAGVNAQTAMHLTGHTQMATHVKYLSRSEVLTVPAAMLPALVG